jgi:hypothetical protein
MIRRIRCLIVHEAYFDEVSGHDLYRLKILADSKSKEGLKDDILEASAASATVGNFDK